MTRKFFVTTAIDYVNSTPHLGTAYEKIGADVLARFARLAGRDTLFLMGTDEHSLNVEKQARAEGLAPEKYCEKMSAQFQQVWKALDISNDDFVRTSQKRHHQAVADLFGKIHAAGDIYKGKYSGWYCVSCEAFQTDKDLKDGACPVHGSKPQWIEEHNYFFKLSKYQQALLDHYEKNPGFICPEIRKNEIVNVVKGGLQDISISRSSVGWGIPVPIEPTQVVYVWFDALINYLTGARDHWPADVHVIGKDITRFHCVIWPAMLMSAKLPLPKKVFGHGFVYIKGAKMSKTDGRKVEPLEAAARYGTDALRYYLMREIAFDRDGDFSWENFQTRYEADLANDLGNLVSRVLSMIGRYCAGAVPDIAGKSDAQAREAAEKMIRALPGLYDALDFSGALSEIWSLIQWANRRVDEAAPWKLAKDPAAKDRLHQVLYDLAEILRIIAIAVSPVMPTIAQKIFGQLGLSGAAHSWDKDMRWALLPAGQKLGALAPLFPKEERK